MPKFRKKPVEIEARQWDGTEAGAWPILKWINDHLGSDKALYCVGPGSETKEIEIETLEGTMCASSGDWIIRGIKGEFYPCKPDVFAMKYEPA